MITIFDGKKFAEQKRESLRLKIEKLKAGGKTPKLVSILVGNEGGNIFYTNLKKKTAEGLGMYFEIVNLGENTDKYEIISKIKELNDDPSVSGIMVQMPLPGVLKAGTSDIVNTIDPQKDVDGLGVTSPFLHPTAGAIVEAIAQSKKDKNSVCVVVGATGMVGRALVSELKRLGYKVVGCNSKTPDLKAETLKGDIVVSVTGKPGIISGDMVKSGAAVIDVGYPKPDATEDVYSIASFLTPVPGGIGPVTLAKLMENLVSACQGVSKDL